MQKYKYDVLGIGNAVTDIFVEVEESLLKKIHKDKNTDRIKATMLLFENI